MATPREIRYRVLYVAIGLVLTAITLLVAISHLNLWWAAVPGLLAFGWWSTLIEAWVARLFEPGDAYRHRPE